MQINRPLALVICLGALAPATAATASSAGGSARTRINADIRDGKLKHCYTVKQLKAYKRAIGADTKQYSPDTVKAVRRELRYAKHHKIHPKRAACR